MNSRFNFTASNLSTEELNERIDNREKYLPETIEASVAELQNRGQLFTDEELQVINQDLQAQRDNATLPNRGHGLFSSEYKNNIVEDIDAPHLYSRRAVYLFTFFMGALFGSIMMAINLSKTKNRAGIAWILLFGFVFTVLQKLISGYLNQSNSAGFLFGLIAAFFIDYFFWDRFIGNNTFYRAKSIWIPLAIAITLTVIMLWAITRYGAN